MAVGYGMRGHCLWNMQNSYGTSQVTSQYAVPIMTEGLTYNIEQLVEGNMYSRFGESPYHAGTRMVQGEIAMEAHPIAMGWLLRSVIGASITTSAAGIQTHVMMPVASDYDDRSAVRPATIEIHRDVGSAFLFYDMLGNNMSIEIANGQLLKISAGFMGAGFSRKAAGTPTYPVAAPFVWDQTSASYNGAAFDSVRNMTITFNNNLEAQYTLSGSNTPYRIKRNNQQMVEISGTVVFAAHSYHQAFEAQSEVPLVIHCVGRNAPNTITFDFPAYRIKTFNPQIGGKGLIEASFTGGAMFSTTSNTAARVTLVNTLPSYVA